MKHVLFVVLASLAALALAQGDPNNFYWKAPTARENGQALAANEIGGYELIGTDESGVVLWRHVLPAGVNRYRATASQIQAPQYRIAAFDTNGLYSDYVPIVPKRLAPPTHGRIIYED